MKNINLYKIVKISFMGILLTSISQSALAFTSTEQRHNYIIKYGVEGQKRLNELNRLIKDYQYSPIKTKLKVVNDFFNSFTYISDKQLWGKNDYWTTPIEFLGVGMGDCEDYAIAKFDALTRMRINKDKLRLI